MNKEYVEITTFIGSDISDAVKELLKQKEAGILASINFNGTVLYSDTVTLDDAYVAITGKTKEQREKEREEWRENYRRQEEEYKSTIPTITQQWINKGHQILTQDKWKLWDEVVPIRLGDLYHGMELGACLAIIKRLNDNCALDEAKKIIEDQNHSGMSFGLVKAMVKAFCERGKEFADYVN